MQPPSDRKSCEQHLIAHFWRQFFRMLFEKSAKWNSLYEQMVLTEADGIGIFNQHDLIFLGAHRT